MVLNTKEISLFDGEPNYEFLIEKGVMTREEAEKRIKFKELNKEYLEALSNGNYDLADEIMAQMDAIDK